MNVQALLLGIGVLEGFIKKYRERLEKNGRVAKDEIDDILKEVVIEALPGGDMILSLAEKLKDMVDGEN